MSAFVWFEHVSTDATRARAFYAALFGWRTNDERIVQGDAAIGAYREPAAGGPGQSHWLSHLGVDDVAQAAAKAKELGATILSTDADRTVVADPAGAVFALRRGASTSEGDHRFCWNELYTTDLPTSVAFYRAITGLDESSMTMGEQPYTMLMDGETPVAGFAPPPAFERPITWQPVVAVPDAGASLATATTLGATILAPIEDVPTIGRFFVIADPLGAVLGILQRA